MPRIRSDVAARADDSPLPAGPPAGELAARIVDWQRRAGRHDLPWQGTGDPYRIWLSEIMLQQTQVGAVLGYYGRFLERFPTLASLAAAPVDDVLQLWSGLGYYSRARNLHRCARELVERFGGRFPADEAQLATLPGIGRSTAAAIAAFAWGRRAAILDGNVKRVLCRAFGVEGFPGEPAVERLLWRLAERELPPADTVAAYTQGLMDLGATVCTRSRPRCEVCPLAGFCAARAQGRQGELPGPRPRRATPTRHAGLLVLLDGDRVLLEQRPPTGIWGGLWSLPQTPFSDEPTAPDALAQLAAALGIAASLQPLPPLHHAFTHFRLVAQPMLGFAGGPRESASETGVPPRSDRGEPPTPSLESLRTDVVRDRAGWRWLPLSDAAAAALPTPIKSLLVSLAAPGGAGPFAQQSIPLG